MTAVIPDGLSDDRSHAPRRAGNASLTPTTHGDTRHDWHRTDDPLVMVPLMAFVVWRRVRAQIRPPADPAQAA